MISVRGRGRPRQERLSVAPSVVPSVAPSVAPPDSSPLPESENFEQPEESPADTSIPKYSENNLQRILKAVLESRAPTLAPAVSETPREKLKARSPDVYHRKYYIDCYNFCQQCEDYFATIGATGPTRIPFAASFLWDRISFRWQQYKRGHDADTLVPVMWDEFKAFFRWSLGDSQAFVDAY